MPITGLLLLEDGSYGNNANYPSFRGDCTASTVSRYNAFRLILYCKPKV